MEIYILFAFLTILTSGVLWARNAEKKSWNGGSCADCGTPWRRFDTDSQGGRGYKCEGGHGTWISYGVDKGYKHDSGLIVLARK